MSQPKQIVFKTFPESSRTNTDANTQPQKSDQTPTEMGGGSPPTSSSMNHSPPLRSGTTSKTSQKTSAQKILWLLQHPSNQHGSITTTQSETPSTPSPTSPTPLLDKRMEEMLARNSPQSLPKKCLPNSQLNSKSSEKPIQESSESVEPINNSTHSSHEIVKKKSSKKPCETTPPTTEELAAFYDKATKMVKGSDTCPWCWEWDIFCANLLSPGWHHHECPFHIYLKNRKSI